MVKIGTTTIIQSEEDRHKEKGMLCNNLQLIMDNADYILSTPELFYCKLNIAYLGICYVGRPGHIPLGVLVTLWKKGELIEQCPECSGPLYIFQSLGIPLSGSNSSMGACTRCKKTHKINAESFGDIFGPINEMMKKHRNKEVVIQGSRPVFNWGKGIIGEYTPDEIVKDKIHGVNLETLVSKLKEKL